MDRSLEISEKATGRLVQARDVDGLGWRGCDCEQKGVLVRRLSWPGMRRALRVMPPGSHMVTCGQTVDRAVKKRGVIYTISLPPTPLQLGSLHLNTHLILGTRKS